MRIDESKILKIMNKYDKTVENTGAFLLEIDDGALYITDSCEGVDMVQLDKDKCFKLADMFRELGENL
jgi:hypothetical protein